jgi:ferredoxin
MKIKKLSISRRILQVLFLIVIIYGAYIFKGGVIDKPNEPPAQSEAKGLFPALKPSKGSLSSEQFKKGSILWPSGDMPVFENYPPSLVCRFNPKGGLFKACIVHLVSENLTWRTNIRYLLPHITLFILLCFLFGRMWCGWVCPIGSVGDFLTWLRRKMNIPVKRFPVLMRKGLRTSSYGIMTLTFSISAFIGIPNYARFQCYWFLPYCQICPARLICPLFGFIKPNWKDFSTAVSAGFTILAWILLGLFIAAFYWGRRVWCHLCPIGLMNSWFNRGSGVELKKDAIKCNKCGSCADSCPMGLTEMYEADKNIIYNDKHCIMCMRCVDVCPRDSCLSVNFFGKKLFESKY